MGPIKRKEGQSTEKVEIVRQEYVRKYFLAAYENLEDNQVCKIPIINRTCKEQRNIKLHNENVICQIWIVGNYN